jgi:hypothetical protein
MTLPAALLVPLLLGPARPAAAQTDDDVGRAVGGTLIGAGVLTAVVGGVVLLALGGGAGNSEGAGLVALGMVSVAPAAAAAATCRYQNRSPRYHAGCGLPVLAAYAGAVAGGYATYKILDSSSSASSGTFLAFTPVLLAPSASAALTWQLLKEPISEGRIEHVQIEAPPAFERRARMQPTCGAPLVLRLLAGRF